MNSLIVLFFVLLFWNPVQEVHAGPVTEETLSSSIATTDSGICDLNGALQCIQNSEVLGQTGQDPNPFISGSNKNITMYQIQKYCAFVKYAHDCFRANLHTCSAEYQLLLDLLLHMWRYECQENIAGLYANMNCLYQVIRLGRGGCLEQSAQDIYKYLNGGIPIMSAIATDEFCSLASNFTTCFLDTTLSICGRQGHDYYYGYLRYLSIPVKNRLQCDLLTESYAATNSSVAVDPVDAFPSSVPTSDDVCDIYGAAQCLQVVEPLGKTETDPNPFISGTYKNITMNQLQQYCTSLQNAYDCIGTKLDTCSEEIRLLRDTVLYASRYICNEDSAGLLVNLECLVRLGLLSDSDECMKESIREIVMFFKGNKQVRAASDEFCSLVSNFTSCFMEFSLSICGRQGYEFLYRFTNYTAAPLRNSLQCNVIPEFLSTTTVSGTTQLPTSSKPSFVECRYIGSQKSSRTLDKWCDRVCNRGNCPSNQCRCKVKTSKPMCWAIGKFRKVAGSSQWCNENCLTHHCPRYKCRCKKRF